MRITWQTGEPRKSGVYLAWNTWMGDLYPTVMHFNRERSWWTYRVHRNVIQETLSAAFNFMSETLHKHLCDSLKLTDKQKKELEKLGKRLSLKGYPDEGYTVCEFALLEALERWECELNDCVYDEGAPEYWAELPFLLDEAIDAMGTDNPNEMDIEIADARAEAVSQIARQVEKIINHSISGLVSPWEGGNNAARLPETRPF